MGKRKLDKTADERQAESQYLEKAAPHTMVKHILDQQKRLIVILERANLEVIKVSKCFFCKFLKNFNLFCEICMYSVIFSI